MEATQEPHGATDRRTQSDRRRRPTPMFSRYTFFGGRRADSRRDGERAFYVDLYPRSLLFVLVGIFSLSCVDAIFTLYIVTDLGGSEANPVMDFFLQMGISPFLITKIILTSLGIFVLCVHKNFAGVRLALFILMAVYVGVAMYHLYLVNR